MKTSKAIYLTFIFIISSIMIVLHGMIVDLILKPFNMPMMMDIIIIAITYIIYSEVVQRNNLMRYDKVIKNDKSNPVYKVVNVYMFTGTATIKAIRNFKTIIKYTASTIKGNKGV